MFSHQNVVVVVFQCSWFYNMFDTYIADDIRDGLNKQVCSLATSSINTAANKALATIPSEYLQAAEVLLSTNEKVLVSMFAKHCNKYIVKRKSIWRHNMALLSDYLINMSMSDGQSSTMGINNSLFFLIFSHTHTDLGRVALITVID